MEEEEIRAEIEKRRRRALDLRIHETIWDLYRSQFKYIAAHINEDPESVLPQVRETLRIVGNFCIFGFGPAEYKIGCYEKSSKSDRSGSDEIVTTSSVVELEADGQVVLEFFVLSIVTYTREMPFFDDILGEITGFIEGPWVEAIPDLLAKMRSHEQDVRNRRNAPREAQKLREEMKRFGL
ncbi:MAG: hypothetical protein WBG54_03375 [Acidobacteriaceae bacterium]